MSRPLSRLATLFVPLAAFFAISACSSSSGGGDGDVADDVTGGDTLSVADTTAPPADTTPSPDTTPEPDTQTTMVPSYPDHCTEMGFAAYAQDFGQVNSGVMAYQAVTTNRSPYDVLSFEFYGGDFGGATQSGVYDLDGSNYETCGNCVLVRTSCADGGSCDKTFYADEGDLVITDWSPDAGFTGYLDSVVLKEVTIDPNTFRSTPVQGGAVWCLDAYQFEAEIPKPIVGGENTQPVCVTEGTGTLVGDNVAQITWTNCLGKEVRLHDTCGQSKALWLLGSAGWCQPCADLIASIVADNGGGTLSRELVATNTPGLDLIVVLGEDSFGNAPSQEYCATYAADHKLDPAMVVIDNTPAGVRIPLIDPQGYALEVNSFATMWTYINPYLVAQGESVTLSTPWLALLRGANMEYAWSQDSGTGTFEGTLNQLLSEQ